MKEIKIEVPQGYEAVLDQETNTLKIVPKENDKITYDSIKTRAVFYTTDFGLVVEDYTHKADGCIPPKGAFKNRETAEAVIALAQLEWLRDEYIKRYYPENPNWKPNWEDGEELKNCIKICENSLTPSLSFLTQRFLAFPTEKIRDRFLEEQRELIEQAKPLL